MEVLTGIQSYFLKEPRPFTSKRDLNWGKVKIVSITIVLTFIVAILVWPAPQPDQLVFHEKGDTTNGIRGEPADPTHETVKQLQEARGGEQRIHESLDYLYQKDPGPSNGGGGNQLNRNSGMIISRNGFDSKTQLSPGTRIRILLVQGVTVETQAMPIIGRVVKDVQTENGIAIPSDSKVIGDVSFDPGSERTTVIWRSIVLPDGRERPFSAQGMGGDGHLGVDAKVHSMGVRNVMGQTLTKFVGAYAAGSINTGAFGANPGGNKNGFKNAIAETASERANAMGESLQKERKWAELEAGSEVMSVLNQPFSFREPGGVN